MAHTIGPSNNPVLGMIVDKSSFDEEDDLVLGKEFIIDDAGTQSDTGVGSGGVVMRNGKVRRRLRWKPPTFRRKKNNRNPSSSGSVISALTNRSSITTRSQSTTDSFLTNFSGKSKDSTHTFHSTATPVVTNKLSQKPKKCSLPRPTYPDTFEAKHATIESEGFHQRQDSENSFLDKLNEVTIVRSSTLPSRLDDTPISPLGGESPRSFNANGSSAASVNSDPFDFSNLPSPQSKASRRPPRRGKSAASVNSDPFDFSNLPSTQNKASKRPPRGKKKVSSSPKSPIPEGSSESAENTEPVQTSTSEPALSAPIHPTEREESALPRLPAEEYHVDRRVGLRIGTASRTTEDFEQPLGNETVPAPQPPESALETMLTDTGESQPITGSSVTDPPLPPAARKSPEHPPKSYNRPIDTTDLTDAPTVAHEVFMTESDEGMETEHIESVSLLEASSNVLAGAENDSFLEAEHNLRAIHDMAAEHLVHGEYREAIEVFEEILRGQKERHGADHYRVGTSLHNLGIVHLKAGDQKKAIKMCALAVQVRTVALAPNHPDVAVSLAQLGVAHLELREFEDALVAFRKALNIRRTSLGKKHPKCSKILNNIGVALFSLDEFQYSQLAFEEALDIQRETLRMLPTAQGTQDEANQQSNQILLSIASALCNIGTIKLRWKQFDEAGVALEEAMLVSVLEWPACSSLFALLSSQYCLGFV
jgi:tetratricopeptide (TPR) repeat protein